MCQNAKPGLPFALAATAAAAGLTLPAWPSPSPAPAALPAACASTRRRRLWDLEPHAHCPVIGVCVPIAALRRLVGKLADGPSAEDDYELHTGTVALCRQRNRTSEALNKHLDQRYALLVQRAAKARTSEDLAAWWTEASAGHELPGALWAALTHPRCTPALENAILGQVHMLQHQVGMAARVELARVEALVDENATLTRELDQLQARSLRQAAESAARIDALESDLLRQRALTVAGQTEQARLREHLAALAQAVPQLEERHALAHQLSALRTQVQDLQRDLALAREAATRAQQRAQAAEQRLPASAVAPAAAAPAPVALAHQAVLCVGGRTASVPLYRQVVERIGARFLHHDGGEEDSAAKLDATLAAADLVICQTGCVSHDAYWRVKDHCKRTGKRCVFVETPSRSALERALAEAGAATP